MMNDACGKEQRLLRLWRDWQELLTTAPCSHDCRDMERAIYRLLKATPPWDEVDAEQLHREAYPVPKERPPLHLPDHWGLTRSDVMEAGHW